MKNLNTGSQVPEFSLPDQNGKEFNISSILGKKILVIYFYPKDDTPGCTKEACSFRDQFEDFADAGAEVIGISSDNVESHRNFAQKHKLPFTLLSDEKNQIRKMFGVPKDMLGFIPGRVTYVVGKDGIIKHVFKSQLNAEKHVEEALKVIKTLD